MSTIVNRDIVVRQGAEYRTQYQRIHPRYVFEAQNRGTSAASAPVFPTTIDGTVVDNDITWLNEGLWNLGADPELSVWMPSTAYSRRSRVVTPIDPVDLTSYTGAFQIRATIDAASPLYSGSVIFGTRANGEFSMVIPTADTTALDFDRAVYDLELTNVLNEVDFVVRGKVHLIREVTR